MAEEKVLLTMRLPRLLRDEFQSALLQRDETASQVLRRAIRAYIQQCRSMSASPAPSLALDSEAPKNQGAATSAVTAAEPQPQQPQGGPESQTATPKSAFAGFAAMCGIDNE